MQEFIKTSWGPHFPGPQPISIERRHFGLFDTQPYLICEKTDGVRYILASIPDGLFIMNRAMHVTRVPSLRVPKDTLLDGELVELKTKKWVYIVYDAVRIKGEDLREQPLTTRLEKARALVKTIVKTAGAPFEIRVKIMYPLERAKDLPHLDAFEYETDGIVLTPVNEPIRLGTHETMFKWKPRERITIDFQLKLGKYLYVQDKGIPYKESELHVPSPLPDGTIVECGYGPTGWFIEKARTDKTHANNRRTYYRTIVNLRENIQLDEIIGREPYRTPLSSLPV